MQSPIRDRTAQKEERKDAPYGACGLGTRIPTNCPENFLRNKTQRHRDAENDLNTENTELTKSFRSFREFRVRKKQTTDFWDFRDVNHERKRHNPFLSMQSVFKKNKTTDF